MLSHLFLTGHMWIQLVPLFFEINFKNKEFIQEKRSKKLSVKISQFEEKNKTAD